MKLPNYVQTAYANLFTKYFRYLLAVSVVLIFTAGYFLLIKSQFDNVRLVGVLAFKNETARLNDRQAYLQRVTSMVDAYRIALGDRPDLAENVLPVSLDNGQIFLTMQAIANQADMTLSTVTINKNASDVGRSIQVGSTGTGISSDTLAADIAKALSATPYSLKTASIGVSFGGTPEYEAYKKLLKTIEQSARLFDLYQISYNFQGQGAEQIGTLEKQQVQTSYSFELKTYFLAQNDAGAK